ncbi:MAG: hypothetical protein LBJ44_05145 [Propionibacteriaceae bacterium]|jgi:hypothetical protein|nr:hypothetical protein [Propionibacteriaceae bacterium]
MEHLFMFVAALGGGFFGAAIGGNYVFALTGFSILAAIGAAASGATDFSANLFNYVSFGPFLGPNIAFGGAVAAAAYAAKRGYLDGGKDIVKPLAGLGKMDVLAVGALFGGLGYLIKTGVAEIPWFGGHTDAVATTVIISAILSRMCFGDHKLFNTEKGKLLSTAEGQHWLDYHEKPTQLLTMGLLGGLFAAGVSVYLGVTVPGIGMMANTLPFAFSAITILILSLGGTTPVTHHVTNIAGLGALVFYPVVAGIDSLAASNGVINWGAALGAMLIGTVFGIVAAFLGELFARLFQIRGNTHIDPPAFAIFTGNTLVWVVFALVG